MTSQTEITKAEINHPETCIKKWASNVCSKSMEGAISTMKKLIENHNNKDKTKDRG